MILLHAKLGNEKEAVDTTIVTSGDFDAVFEGELAENYVVLEPVSGGLVLYKVVAKCIYDTTTKSGESSITTTHNLHMLRKMTPPVGTMVTYTKSEAEIYKTFVAQDPEWN